MDPWSLWTKPQAPPTALLQDILTKYLVKASVCPKILRTGQAVLPLEPSSTHPIGLPGSSSIQMVVTGGCRHSCRAGGGGAPAGQSLFPVVDQLPDRGPGRLLGVLPHNSRSLHIVPVGAGPPTALAVPTSLMLHSTPHYHQPCPPCIQVPTAGPHPTILTGGLRAAPGCTCPHHAWLHCAQPQWPGQWLEGHPAPGPEGRGKGGTVRPRGQRRVLSPGRAQDGAPGRQRTTTAEAWHARCGHRKLD